MLNCLSYRRRVIGRATAPGPEGTPVAALIGGHRRRKSEDGMSDLKTDLKLQVIPLGGLGEFGMNMTAIRYGDDIIVVDSGMMFPDAELLGVDLVMPDLTFLKENQEQVRALF